MTALSCIDLRPWADSHRYRWTVEEPHSEREADAEWFIEVLCHYGRIYPYGGETLLAYCSRGVKRHIAKLAGAMHHQHDGDNQVFRFPAELLDQVAAILKPKRRRTLDPDRARAIGEATAYGAQGGKAAQESTQGGKAELCP